MKAVILAAGGGGRLGLLTAQRPKALLPLLDRPIIDYVITSLAGAGLRDVVVVLGHCGEMLQEHLGDGSGLGVRVEYVWNRQYRYGNARSLWCAREALAQNPFVVAMSDHLCSASLVRALCAAAGRRSVLAVDSSDLGPERTREATKVLVSPEHRVLNLGKGLLGWNAVDTGLVYCVPAVYDLMWPDLRDGELSQVMAALARWERAAGGLEACDVSGRFWMDIDTEADLHLAESLLRRDVSILA